MIIVAITGPTMRDALGQVSRSSRYADMFEFRLDVIRAPVLPTLLGATKKPRIATCRPTWEGGGYAGKESDRFAILLEANALGAEFIDIELKARAAFLRHARRAETRGSTPLRATLILSHHINDVRHIDAGKVYRRFRDIGTGIAKFAYQANDAWQIDHARQFLALAARQGRKAIAIAMGDPGEASRVLYQVFGGWATYASAESGSPSAPGQIPASILRNVYRAHRLNKRSRVFGVIGSPLVHSKGMFMHNAVFAKAHLNAVYCRFPVNDLHRFLAGYGRHLSGLSVTIPHKESVQSHVVKTSSVADAIGAINTLVRTPRGWYGDNTDASGALDAVEKVTRVRRKRVLIIGAGGTARALSYEARRRGADVTVTNRTETRGRALARDLGVRFVTQRDVVSYRFEVIMNATSAGMWPHVTSEALPDLPLSGVVCFDAVFNPSVTTFLKRALREGGRIVSGVEMYVNQAIAQDRLFVRVSPSAHFLKKTLTVATRKP